MVSLACKFFVFVSSAFSLAMAVSTETYPRTQRRQVGVHHHEAAGSGIMKAAAAAGGVVAAGGAASAWFDWMLGSQCSSRPCDDESNEPSVVVCPAGTQLGDEVCEPCESGSVSSDGGVCTQCGSGSVTTDHITCTACSVGFIPNANRTSCVCPDEYVELLSVDGTQTCRACPHPSDRDMISTVFDFDDWASRASWCIKFLLLAFVLHLVVSWIYKD